MGFPEIVGRAKAHLREQGRVSLRGLKREFDLDDEALEELVAFSTSPVCGPIRTRIGSSARVWS